MQSYGRQFRCWTSFFFHKITIDVNLCKFQIYLRLIMDSRKLYALITFYICLDIYKQVTFFSLLQRTQAQEKCFHFNGTNTKLSPAFHLGLKFAASVRARLSVKVSLVSLFTILSEHKNYLNMRIPNDRHLSFCLCDLQTPHIFTSCPVIGSGSVLCAKYPLHT